MSDQPEITSLTVSQIYRELSSLRESLETRLDAMDRAQSLFQENLVRTYERTLMETDLRYQQRYDASDKALQSASLAAKEAVNAALAAAKEAVNAASISTEKSVAAAFAASEKAIDKAEAAQRAHNTSQNEWRATINDLTKTVAERARTESETMVGALRTNTEISIRSMTDKIDGALARLDKHEGRGTQASSTQSTLLAGTAILISLVTAAVAIFGAFNADRGVTSGVSISPPVVVSPPGGMSSQP